MSPSDQRKLLEAGISRRHLRLLLKADEALLETTSLREARRFLADDNLWCLILLGGHGAGKTLAAEWFMLACLQAGRCANSGARRLITPFDLQDAAYDPEERRRQQQQQLLIIDDLGCEASGKSEALRWVLFELVDQRWRNNRKTVITSNLTAKGLKYRYGQRVTERLGSSSMCTAIAGPNLRRPHEI